MSNAENEKPLEGSQDVGAAAEKPAGAFGRDKKFGNRLDQVMAIGEPFLLLGARPVDAVTTVYGESECQELLVQKLNKDTGVPQGPPIRCNTVLSAVVEKVKELTAEELAAGPVVQLQVVAAKRRGGKAATVMSWIRNLADEDDFSEFGIDPSQVSKIVDQARPAGERIPY